jgi:hypothetical protein
VASFDEVSSVIDYLISLYPYLSGKLTADRIENMYAAYHGILCDMEYANLKAAAVHVAATHKFFPAASEIREAVFHLMTVANHVPSADDAWAEVSKKLRSQHAATIIGETEDGAVIITSGTLGVDENGFIIEHEPQWSTPLIHNAIDAIGGWRYLRSSCDAMADSVHFKKAYDGYFERNKEATLMLPAVRQAVEKLAGAMRPRIEAGHDC